MSTATWASNPWLWVLSFRRLVPGEWEAGPAERPILFRGEMVRAILEGRKTQTRRVVKHADVRDAGAATTACYVTRRDVRERGKVVAHEDVLVDCPYGKPGDRLWVRETWRTWERPDDGTDGIIHQADNAFTPIQNTREASDAWVQVHDRRGKWRPSIHMPRWACRLVLEVTDVRVERLHDVSEEDAKAEGVDDAWALAHRVPAGRDGFRSLWESIHG